MVEGVADDGVLFGEERLEETAVGVEAGGVEDGVFGLEVVADGFLKLLMEILGAADEAHRRHAVAATVHSLLCSLDQTAVVGKAEIVVGAEIEHLALCACHLDVAALRSDNHALVLV